MAEHPKVEALWQNIGFIQDNMATGGLSTIASHLLQLDLITRQNYRDSLTPGGRGPDDQAAMLMRTVESRIRNSPDVYFSRFIEALRRSNLGYVADRLVQVLEETEDQRHSSCTSHDMITSSVLSYSGSSQTTATSHNQFSSFSNQPSSRYPIPPNSIPYNPFPPYLLPVQQPVLPPSYPQAYHSSSPYTLQQGNDPTRVPGPSDFPDSNSHTSKTSKTSITKHSSHQQSFPSRQSYTSIHDYTIHSIAPSLPPTTTTSGITASPSSPPAHQHPLSPAMQRYVTYLKNVYKNKATPVYDKEHSLLQVKTKSFINIALVHKHTPRYLKDSGRYEMIMDRLHGHVDAIQKMKTKLFIHDVCKSQNGRLARSVLVEGAPGVGKTTFANELCKRWARGEILWEWAAVVLIKLRDHTTRTAQNMYDLLYHPRPEVQQAVVDELIDRDGECTLLILDGYDELTDSQKKSTSVIQQIMSKKLFCLSTLMVTSRPLATKTLHDNFVQSIDQHIEVLGFTEKNIEEYIQSACGDKPELVEDFKSYLSFHPFSSALMFNPLQCAIVTDLYRSHWERGDKGFAPKTLTELYTGLVNIMLLRYLTQYPVYKDKVHKIEDLSDLPEEVSQQLKAVTELAAKGIRNQQYVFDEFNTIIPSETLGLMQKEEVVTSGIGISASHNFLHLTLQEYLAAVNYSKQYSSPEQLSQLLTQDDLIPLNNFFQYYGMKREPTLYSSATHWPVVLFVAGRTKLRGVPTNIFKTGLHDSNDDNDITTVEVSLLHLLYETQSPHLIQSTLVTSRKYLSVSGSSALDWFVIGYCIANSTSTWRVEIHNNDSPKYFDQLVMGLCLGPEKCSGEGKIGSLHISGHWTGNRKILTNLQPYATSVTEIELSCDEQGEQEDPEGSKTKLVYEEVLPCYSMLENFTISSVETSYSDSLLSFISQHSNLHILSLNQCNLSSIATRSLIHTLQPPHCRIHGLAIHQCTIPSTEHAQLVTAIVSSPTITFLLFSSDMLINTPTLTALASGLKHNVTLEKLVIDQLACGFTEGQFRVLIDAVDISAVKMLWLPTYYKQWFSDCPISRTNISIKWFNNTINMLRLFSMSGNPLVRGHDEEESLQPMDTAMEPAWSASHYKYKDRKSLFLALDKRNEKLKRQDQLIIELKQKLKDKDQESESYARSLQSLQQDIDKQTGDAVKSDFNEQADFIYKLKQEKQELEYEKVKVMEDIKKKDDHMRVLLAENQLLKQQAQEQEEQVAELKQELEGKEKVMKKLYTDLDRKSETLLKQQLAKQVNTHTQSDISFPISENPHVVGEKVFHIEGRAPLLLSWEEYGFRIRVPENITSGACDVTVKAIVAAGQIDLPEDCELVSAVYDISLSRKFTESIAIEIEHCAKLENEAQCEYLSFVISQHDGPFRLVNGGTFVPRSRYGTIFRSCFCKAAVVKGYSKLLLCRPASKIPVSCKMQAIKMKAPKCSTSQENNVLHEATSDFVTVEDAKLHPNNVVPYHDGEAATTSTVSSEQHDTESDCSPNTTYNALVFDARDGQDLMWRFMVFNNLKAVDKFISEVSFMDKWSEKSRKTFEFAGKYLLLDLPEKECKDGWQILPYASYPYKIHESEVKSSRFAYCQLRVVRDPQGSSFLLHRKVLVQHVVTEDDPYAVYIMHSLSAGFFQTSGNKKSACDGEHGEPSTRELMNRVAARCMNKWKHVGVQLEIEDAQLKSIRSSCETDQQLCFMEVFDHWKGNGNPPYTWTTIINVLKTPSVCEEKVARDLLKWLNGGENSSQ